MNEALKHRALADIDRVLTYRPDYGGTGAVLEVATSFKACILRWAAPGSAHHAMATAIQLEAPWSKLEQHVRALMATFRRDVEAGQVELVDPSPSTGDVPAPAAGTKMATRIFISHASDDKKLAKAVIDLIQAGIAVPDEAVRCTSVDGYGLEGGDDAPEVLRANLRSSAVVLAMITRASVSSSYVLMELGAAWSFKTKAIPLIGPGATFSDLPGFFRDIHSLKLDDEAGMSGLLTTIAGATGFGEINNKPKIQAALQALKAMATSTAAPGVSARPPLSLKKMPPAKTLGTQAPAFSEARPSRQPRGRPLARSWNGSIRRSQSSQVIGRPSGSNARTSCHGS